MTQKAIENVFLTECELCGGEGVVEEGQYDDVRIVDCVCRKEEKAQKTADGLEEANIDQDYYAA